MLGTIAGDERGVGDSGRGGERCGIPAYCRLQATRARKDNLIFCDIHIASFKCFPCMLLKYSLYSYSIIINREKILARWLLTSSLQS